MIALDTNILLRFLIDDDREQVEAARSLLEQLTPERPGFVCREVTVEVVWVLERSYGFSRDRIATALEQLVSGDALLFEAGDDVIRAAYGYRRGGAGFADRMIAAAARRSGADALYTFDRRLAALQDVIALETASG